MKFINFHTHSLAADVSCIEVLNMRQGSRLSFPVGFYSYGVHPWDSDIEKVVDLSEEMITDNKLIYIGECGLDKLKGASLEVQADLFIQHVELSERLKKPLLIHCVRSFNELIQIYKSLSPKMQWMVHGFSGSPQLAVQLVEMGWMLSFGEALLRSNQKAMKSLEAVPLDRCMLETDDSNHSIKEIYEATAIIKQISMEQLKEALMNNFRTLLSSF